MFRTVIVAILLLALSPAAVAQLSVDVDFGVRGGGFNSGIPIEVGNNHYFPNGYSTETHPYTFGPAVGVLFNDRFEVRFEAVRSRFRFQGQSSTPFPISRSKSSWVTDGHVWQYPLLATYHVGSGPARVFGGGGLSFGRTFGGTTRGQTTTVVGPLNPNVPFDTVTTTSMGPFKPDSILHPMAFYITGGIDGRVSFLSIRPEFRYGHWIHFDRRSDIGVQDDTILFSPNQFEFLIGISLHPLRFKGGRPH